MLVDNVLLFENYRIKSLKKIKPRNLREKALQVRYGLRVNPTLDSLPPPFHANEACLAKFFHMMRDRGSHDVEVLAELPDTGTSLRRRVGADAGDRARLAAGDQAHKKSQAVRI